MEETTKEDQGKNGAERINNILVFLSLKYSKYELRYPIVSPRATIYNIIMTIK